MSVPIFASTVDRMCGRLCFLMRGAVDSEQARKNGKIWELDWE